MELSTTISGYRVELNTDMDDTPDEPVSGCWIICAGYSASLECADATGALHAGDDERPIPATVVARIRQWAEKNGY